MSNFIYLLKYQNLHMDRANENAMKTVKVTFNNTLPFSETPVLLYQYEHGYDYTPQVWGLWDIDWSAPLSTGFPRGYGYLSHNTSPDEISFFYRVTSTHVQLYCKYAWLSGSPSMVGTVATFTGYVFANDRTTRDFTK